MAEEELFLMKKDEIRGRLVKYSIKAFRMIPDMDRPRILDIGCGSGVSTIELAKLHNGIVTGIDIDQSVLDRFTMKIEEAGLSDRVRAVNCSLFDIAYPDESFDIVWSEGSIYVIGFKQGLQEWRRFLKPDGYMMIHDEKGNVEQKLEQVSECGYELLDYFILEKEIWLAEYFAPLQRLINDAEKKYGMSSDIRGEIQNARQEIEWFNEYPERSSSVCLVIRKK